MCTCVISFFFILPGGGSAQHMLQCNTAQLYSAYVANCLIRSLKIDIKQTSPIGYQIILYWQAINRTAALAQKTI